MRRGVCSESWKYLLSHACSSHQQDACKHVQRMCHRCSRAPETPWCHSRTHNPIYYAMHRPHHTVTSHKLCTLCLVPCSVGTRTAQVKFGNTREIGTYRVFAAHAERRLLTRGPGPHRHRSLKHRIIHRNSRIQRHGALQSCCRPQSVCVHGRHRVTLHGLLPVSSGHGEHERAACVEGRGSSSAMGGRMHARQLLEVPSVLCYQWVAAAHRIGSA